MWRRLPLHLRCNQRHGVLLLILISVVVAAGSILLPLWLVRLSGPFTGDNGQKTARDSAPRRGSSLERLVQAAAAAAVGDDNDDTCAVRKTQSSRNITSSIVIDANDFDYVNCGLLGTPSHYPLDQIVPRSLLQCRDWQAIIDDGYLTIIPRDDLFPILHHGRLGGSSKPPTTAIEQGLSLGSVHFHYHEHLNSTAAPGTSTTTTTLVDAEWFLHATFSTPIEAWYLNLSLYVSRALNCTCHLPPLPAAAVAAAAVSTVPTCQCPIFNHAVAATSAARAATTAVVPVQDPTTHATSGVQLAHFFPAMYQMPRAKVASTRAMSSTTTTDPVTPSVAVFRQAYAEVGSGRVFVETMPQDDCRPPRPHTAGDHRRYSVQKFRHRQYLVQFNQCYIQWDKNDFYRPFRGTVQIPKHQVHNLSVHRFDAAVLVTADFYDSFYHALVENLPRLLLVYDLVAADRNLTIVAAKSHGSNEESLLYALAKVWNLESRIVLVDQNDDLMYANVLYIPEPTPCGQLQPLLAQASQRAIRQALQSSNETLLNPFLGLAVHGGSSSNSPPLPVQPLFELVDKWILVIRRRTGSRRWIDNHNEMMTSLRATFPNEQWHVLDEMANDEDNGSRGNSGSNDRSYPTIGVEQWTVFARAKLVIAPHGGALANLLACDVGTHVVEYYGDDMDSNLCYLHLSVALNLHHHPLHMQKPSQNVKDGDGASTTQAGMYEINVPHLLRVVHDILLYIGTSVT